MKDWMTGNDTFTGGNVASGVQVFPLDTTYTFKLGISLFYFHPKGL